MGYTLGENIVRIRGIFFCFTFTIYILAGGRGVFPKFQKLEEGQSLQSLDSSSIEATITIKKQVYV